ncbi:MAG: hypothetical protein N4A33_08880 [Bacteriovoracaceae bacterium]|nr:hypothetical protein [Bacteriovoracaceae bacterium]
MAKYKRRIFIINPKFQLKVSFFICFIVLLATSFYPVTIFDLFEGVSKLVPDKADTLLKSRNDLMIVLILLQTGVLGVVFVTSIFVSHKIAGPMYKLIKSFRQMKDDGELNEVYFRKGDYFQEVVVELNQLIGTIKEQREDDFRYLSEVQTFINNLTFVIPDDKKPVLEEIQAKLIEIQNRYK